MSSPSSNPAGPSQSAVRALAAAAGLELTPERVEALVIQAEPYFAQLRSLDDPRQVGEPAAIFRLDRLEAEK